jgi:chorismate mutase/prephenate dehydratase
VPGQGDDPVVKRFREEISAADREILETVNRRIGLVRELHAYKLERGYPLGDPAREAALIERLEQLNTGPLSSDGLREIYGAIVSEWKRQEAPTTPSRSPLG